jgi:hypothetical protein
MSVSCSLGSAEVVVSVSTLQALSAARVQVVSHWTVQGSSVLVSNLKMIITFLPFILFPYYFSSFLAANRFIVCFMVNFQCHDVDS